MGGAGSASSTNTKGSTWAPLSHEQTEVLHGTERVHEAQDEDDGEEHVGRSQGEGWSSGEAAERGSGHDREEDALGGRDLREATVALEREGPEQHGHERDRIAGRVVGVRGVELRPALRGPAYHLDQHVLRRLGIQGVEIEELLGVCREDDDATDDEDTDDERATPPVPPRPTTRQHDPHRDRGHSGETDEQGDVGPHDRRAPEPQSQGQHTDDVAGQHLGEAIGGDPDAQEHPRVLADARGPEDHRREEQDEQSIPAMIALGHREPERTYEEEEPKEREPREHEVATELRGSDARVHLAGEHLDEPSPRELPEVLGTSPRGRSGARTLPASAYRIESPVP